MGFIIFAILFVYAFVGYIMTRKLFAPIVVFNLLWSFIVFMTTVQLFGLYETSEQVYYIVLLGCTFFTLGASLKSLFIHRGDRYEYGLNKKIIYSIFFGSFIVMIVIFLAALKLLIAGVPFGLIRYQYMDQILSNYFLEVTYKFFAYPATIAIVTVFLSDYYINKKCNFRLCIMAITLVFFDLVAIGDRLLIIYLLVGTVIIYREVAKKMQKRQRRRIKYILISVIIAFFGILIARGSNAFSGPYLYIAGSLPYFSKRILDIPIDELTYYVTSYQGFFRPIIGCLEKIGIEFESFNLATEFLMSNQHTVYVINTGGEIYNYFCTIFAFFYRDWGIFGVCIHSALFGVVCQDIFDEYRVNKNYYSVSNFIFMLVAILMSFMSFAFAEVGMVWGYIIVRLLVKKIHKT